MMTTRLFSSSATNPDASMRGVTNRCTGLMPSTSIASISSRMVREPRSAHIAVAPAPGHDQHGDQWTDLGDRTERRAGAAQVGGTEFAQQDVQREAHQHGERNRHQQRRRQRNPGDEPALLEEFPPLKRPTEDEFHRVRRHREQAADGLHGTGEIPPERPHLGDHLSAMGYRSFQDRDRRHRSRATDVVREADSRADRPGSPRRRAAERRAPHTAQHQSPPAGGPWPSIRRWGSPAIHPPIARDLRLHELVGPESLGEA